jgi:hypothetical protein
MSEYNAYAIGTKGQPWTENEKKQWLDSAVKARSYQDKVVDVLTPLSHKFDLVQYGALSIAPETYPLYALKTKNWDIHKPVIIITGGVHGYETSGVHGAIQFLQTTAAQYAHQFNIAVLPCVSPWGYEHIARWNPYAIDPNRSFVSESASEEAKSAMDFVADLSGKVLLHIDLHETTDTDESEFRPALAARDGETFIPGAIPDGFYLVGDTENKLPEFEAAIINAVKKVTHIAPTDEKGEIIGTKAEAEGVIYYQVKKLGLCTGMTNAEFTTTTEVYPDSEKVTAENCNTAQVVAIESALAYLNKIEQANSLSFS